MTHYDVHLHTDRGVEISNKGIECTPANIPDILVCIVMDYLKGAPYLGVIKARVTDGRRYTEYILLLENNTVDVYRHVENATRDGSAETALTPAGSKEHQDKEESA